VALNGSGQIIRATTAAGCVGVIIVNSPMAIGEIVDVMTDGEIVELAAADLQANTAPVIGTRYFFDATAGRLTATPPTTATVGFYVGTTIEAGRLVVRAMRAVTT
jgi:single-stranded DNA-specific DHH superfamily exonuclease